MDDFPLKIGCCGFRRSQASYYERFPVVEVQHTFYDPPARKTLEKWRASAPENFEFTLKAWQLITHLGDSPTYRRVKRPLDETELEQCGNFRPTPTVAHALDVTLDCAEALKADKILFQCPPRFTPSDPNVTNLRKFFSKKRPKEMTYLWEPRGKWPPALIQELCRDLNLVHVVDPCKAEPLSTGLLYFRLHGERGKGFVFQDKTLEELKETAEWRRAPAYFLFNNVRMLDDAARFTVLSEGSRSSPHPTPNKNTPGSSPPTPTTSP